VRLRDPVSPHLAARRVGVRIDPSALEFPGGAGPWVVEGAGGVLVPLNESETMADLMVRLALPVVVVARTSLGTINHTLLTLEALRARRLSVAGVVMVGRAPSPAASPLAGSGATRGSRADRGVRPTSGNREAIEHHGRVTILGEMPRFDRLDAACLRAWAEAEFDRAGALAEFLS